MINSPNERKGTHFSSSNDGSLTRLEDYTLPPFLALWMRESNGLLIAERGVWPSKAVGVTEVLLRMGFYQSQSPHWQTGGQTHRHDMCPNPSLNVEQRLTIRFLHGDFNRNLNVLWVPFMSVSSNR